ncbi:hypothetical protein AB0M47_06325 [Hamadaea sp. NPDC051192]|uniref:hypothetical protein n=1 Tax=Hamadaea sp. NPDC051192 TaxID=3154940 RepID=UPI0034322417
MSTDAPRSAWRLLASGWVPAGLTALFAVLLLKAYGVGLTDLALYSGYILVVVALPGLLLWRALRRKAGPIALDIAAGLALGYPLSVFVYIGFRAIGVPQLAVVPSILVVAAFALVPGLRRHWRGSGERAPMWWSWILAGFVVALFCWTAIDFFRRNGTSWPGNSQPYQDMVFHLALAAEFKHHFPAMIPYVIDEPLHYHWYYHAHLAAASWGSGVELQTLLFRLGLMPVLAGFVVLTAYTAKAVVKTWWSGPVAVFFTLVGVSWFNTVGTGWMLINLWISPTQIFAAMIFGALAYLVVDLLPRTATKGEWLLFVLLAAGVAGAKATFVPMLLAAAAFVAAVGLVFRRRLDRTALIATVLTAVVFVGAMLLLFRGGSAGMRIVPFAMRDPAESYAEMALRIVVGWLGVWAGVLGLVVAGRRALNQAVLFCLGLGAAAIGVVLLTSQPGGSQMYFLSSAKPYLVIAAVAGIAGLLGEPVRQWRRGLAFVLVAVMLGGALTNLDAYTKPIENATKTGLRGYPRGTTGQIPRGGIDAMRWLRDHSSPDDLVATNVHCLRPTVPICDSRSFWVSAYAERRVLVEGWVYTDSAMKAAGTRKDYQWTPYWEPEILAANDRVFTAPSAESVAVLRDKYGVRWLAVDRRVPADVTGLAAVADLKYTDHDTLVFEVRR